MLGAGEEKVVLIGVKLDNLFLGAPLRKFWEVYPDAEQPLKAWFDEASRAEWDSPANIKSTYRNASIIANNRVVFNIKGNDYRLIVHVRYDIGIIFIRFIGTHKEYDNLDATSI